VAGKSGGGVEGVGVTQSIRHHFESLMCPEIWTTIQEVNPMAEIGRFIDWKIYCLGQLVGNAHGT
jgi:hypothetical protein